MDGYFYGSFNGDVTSSNVNITGGSISGTTVSGTISSSNATITGGSISGVSLSTSGSVNFNTYGDQTIFFNDTYWGCSSTQTILKFQNTYVCPNNWIQIVYNSCLNKLAFETYSSGVGTTHTETVGGLFYRTITINASSGSVFLINTFESGYTETRFNSISIMGGTVGQTIHIINTSKLTDPGNNYIYMRCYGNFTTYNPSFDTITCRGGGAITLTKVTETETVTYFPNDNRPIGGGARGKWLPVGMGPDHPHVQWRLRYDQIGDPGAA